MRDEKTYEDGASLTLDLLSQSGIDTIFGVPGGAISRFLQRLRTRSDFRFVIAAHEAGAAFMADGYARAGGRTGVCLVTAGPGVTNALTGVVSAHLDQVPFLLISGHVPASLVGTGAIQESTIERGVDTAALVGHSAKYSSSVSDSLNLSRLLMRALSATEAGIPGVAHLRIPSDVARAPAKSAPLTLPADFGKMAWPEGAARDLVEQLQKSVRPLIFLGGGARRAMEQQLDMFVSCAERLAVPVTTSVKGKGIFPESHPLSLGVFGLAGSDKSRLYAANGIDVLVVIGSRLGEWATGGKSDILASSRHVFHIDLDSRAFSQSIPADQPIIESAETFLRSLHAAVDEMSDSDTMRAARTRRISLISDVHPSRQKPATATDLASDDLLSPSTLMEELSRCLNSDVDLYVDMGNCTGWSVRHLTIDPPGRIFIPAGLASMGWSCGAVIGGKIARPDRNAMALVGDGSFLMNGVELATAARQRVGAVYLVLEDGYLGMVNHGESWQTGWDLTDPFYAAGPADMVQFSRSLGAAVTIIRSHGELPFILPRIFEEADRSATPQVLIAPIDHLEPPPYGDRFESVAG